MWDIFWHCLLAFGTPVSVLLALAIYADKKNAKKLTHSALPLGELISGFEDFARAIEGGVLSKEADEAIRVLRAHAERKLLPAKKKSLPLLSYSARYINPLAESFSNEMKECRHSSDEQVEIVRRWMNKYVLSDDWLGYMAETVLKHPARQKIRALFDEQEANNGQDLVG